MQSPDHLRSTWPYLIGGDFSAVESRVLAWVAKEEWKLESYRRFDATQDPRDEPYCITACQIFRVPDGSFIKKSPERGIGKLAISPSAIRARSVLGGSLSRISSPTKRSRSSRPNGERRIPGS